MRNTKIICTLGPATESEAMLRAMVDAGANVFRLNMSHASHDWVRMIVPRIRQVAADLDSVVGILMDTQGPAIRTGDLATKLQLKPGDIVEFTVRGEKSEEQYSVDVNYDGLVDDISVGDTVLVDNGVMHMEVLEKEANRVRCRVLTAGTLGSRRHINLPGVKVNLPPLTEKDLADLALGAELQVDMVALSFCREPSDVDAIRKVLCEHGSNARVIAKIEDQMAVRNISGIIAKADIIMVARGDLGIECAMEDLPIIQRSIVKRCLKSGVPVIVATHLLESMIANPVPTRAEVTDVSNAVYEQADGIMLSGETSVGKYPVKCVETLHRVAYRTERSGGAGYANEAFYTENRQRTMHSAVVLANSLRNSKLVVFTRRGRVADYVSAQRPEHSPIFAFCNTPETCCKISLNWGIVPLLLPFEKDPEETIEAAVNLLRKKGHVHAGDNLVIVSDLQAGQSTFDSIQLRPVL
ncbi:MAG: pyruvate kinase [Chthoniobacteraceae bacterium]